MESRVRASAEQFLTLLEYMESHGDLAKPQPGAQGRLRADGLWAELTNILHSVGGGVTKTPNKWKKVWADWKSKTKKKALTIRRHASGTGGGPSTYSTLTALETRVLGIIGALAVEGHSEVEEHGFDRPSASPSPNVADFTYLTEIAEEDGNLPPPSQSVWQESLAHLAIPSISQSQRHTAPAAQRSPLHPAVPPEFTIPSPSEPLPRSSNTPQRRHQRARRRRTQTPFDRATSEFVAIEQRRLQLEEMRARNDARRIEVDQERNNVFSRFADIAQALLQQYLSRDSDITVPLDTE